MASKDTPIERQMRKAMEAIDAIADMAEFPSQVRLIALSRVRRYAENHHERETVRQALGDDSAVDRIFGADFPALKSLRELLNEDKEAADATD